MTAHDAVVTPIEREELYDRVVRGDPIVLLEVLGEGYWRKHHLPGALNLPPDRVRELAPVLVPDRHTEVVLYCWDDD